MLRGARGAIQAKENSRDSILTAAEQLMRALIEANGIRSEEVASVFFTVTPELDAAFPAAVRDVIGWNLVPFLCGGEIPVPGSLERVIRVLVLFETDRSQEEVSHQYLGATAQLRPDLNRQGAKKECL
jgi:chorismate mutase